MSKFDELLSRPLPSTIMESGTEDLDKAMDSMDKNNTDTQSSSTSDPSMKEGCKEGCNEGKCGSEGCSNEHDHDLCDNNHCDSMHDHIEDLHDHLEDLHDHMHGGDSHDLTDKHYGSSTHSHDHDLHGHDMHDHIEDLHDHLEDLHDHMHGGDSHDLTDKHYNTENDTEVLSPDESQRADDVINAVATPLMLNGELSEAEINEFVESVDSDIAIAEGLLTERTIVKFDKNAKRAQLYEVAVAACAREHNDPDFRKLQTVYKMERILKKKLRKKYNSQAQKKVKEYLARAKKSKSGIISRIAHKITGK